MAESKEEIALYTEYYQFLRYWDRCIWSTPSLMIAIDGGIILACFQNLINLPLLVRGAFLLFGYFFSLALLIALYKHRFFADRYGAVVESIEKGWKGAGKIQDYAPRSTVRPAKSASTLDDVVSWVRRKMASAVTYLFVSGLSITSGMLLLFLEQTSTRRGDALAVLAIGTIITVMLTARIIVVWREDKKEGG